MKIIVVAGPVRPGFGAPALPGLEAFVRPARRDEPACAGPCPSCSGSGVATGRRGLLTWMSTCPRCRGTGIVEGIHLVRIVAEEGTAEVGRLLAWARDNHVRTDVQLLIRNEGGPDWAVRWCDVDQRPLRRWCGHLVSRAALAVLVDHADVHVALHAVRDDGRVAVVGMWDVRVAENRSLVQRWSCRASRSAAWRRRIRFPSDVVYQTLRVAQGRREARARGHDRPCLDRRQVTAAVTPALPGQTAAG